MITYVHIQLVYLILIKQIYALKGAKNTLDKCLGVPGSV